MVCGSCMWFCFCWCFEVASSWVAELAARWAQANVSCIGARSLQPQQLQLAQDGKQWAQSHLAWQRHFPVASESLWRGVLKLCWCWDHPGTGRKLEVTDWQWRVQPPRETWAVNAGRTCQWVLLEEARSLSDGLRVLLLGGYWFKSLTELFRAG